MNAWYNGYADPKEMIKQGYDLISVPDGEVYIVPAAGYYHDYLNTERLYKEWTPAHIGKEVFPENINKSLAGCLLFGTTMPVTASVRRIFITVLSCHADIGR